MLKKRNLEVSIDEAKERTPGIKDYADLERLAKSGGDQAERAKKVLDMIPGLWQTEVDTAPDENYGAPSLIGGQPIQIISKEGKPILTHASKGWRPFKNDRAAGLWQQDINAAFSPDGGNLDPITQDILKIPEVQEMVDYKPTDEEIEAGVPENAGIKLVEVLVKLKKSSEGNPELEKLMDPKITQQASIPVKVRNSLIGDEFRLTTPDELGTKTAYEGYAKPDIIPVTNALENLNKLIELHKKVDPNAEGPLPDITDDDVAFLGSKIALVRHVRRGKGNRPEDRVFIKSNINGEVGFSFDFRGGKGEGTVAGTLFKGILDEIEEGLERASKDKNLTIPEDAIAKITPPPADNGLADVIGEVSEEMPAMVTLLMAGTDEGITKFKEFWEKLVSKHRGEEWEHSKVDPSNLKYKGSGKDKKLKSKRMSGTTFSPITGRYTAAHKIRRAFKLDEVYDDGFLVGTGKEAALNASLAKLVKDYGTNEPGEILQKIATSLMNSVATDMLRLQPKYAARVGKSRAGKEAKGTNDKTDVVLFYPNEEAARAAGKIADTDAKGDPNNSKSKRVIDVVQGEDLENLKELYPDLAKELEASRETLEDGTLGEPQLKMWYTDDNMKCTSDGKTTNAGSTSGPQVIAEQFTNPKDPHSLTLMKALGSPKTLKSMGVQVGGVRECFKTVQSDMKAVDTLLDGLGSTSVGPDEAKQVFLDALGQPALDALGIDETQQQDIHSLISEINGSPDARNKLRAKLQQGLLTRRLERAGDGPEGANWRAAGALTVMRGCYDGNNGSKVVYDYGDEAYYRYNNNKYLMDSMRDYVRTGKGLTHQSAKIGEGSSMAIDGYRGTFTGGSESVGMKWVASVHGKKHKIETPQAPTQASPQEDGIEYSSTELMNKLLEVQQLIFSSLIKE